MLFRSHEIVRLAKQYRGDLQNFNAYHINDFFEFVSKKIKYERDPYNVELISRPAITIKRGAGDCDDKTVLMAAFCELKKIPYGIAVVGNKRQFHHVFIYIYENDKKIDYDATYNTSKIGNIKKWNLRREYSMNLITLEGDEGLGKKKSHKAVSIPAARQVVINQKKAVKAAIKQATTKKQKAALKKEVAKIKKNEQVLKKAEKKAAEKQKAAVKKQKEAEKKSIKKQKAAEKKEKKRASKVVDNTEYDSPIEETENMEEVYEDIPETEDDNSYEENKMEDETEEETSVDENIEGLGKSFVKKIKKKVKKAKKPVKAIKKAVKKPSIKNLKKAGKSVVNSHVAVLKSSANIAQKIKNNPVLGPVANQVPIVSNAVNALADSKAVIDAVKSGLPISKKDGISLLKKNGRALKDIATGKGSLSDKLNAAQKQVTNSVTQELLKASNEILNRLGIADEMYKQEIGRASCRERV